MAESRASHVLHRLILGNINFFMPETTIPKALIFGMKQHFVNRNCLYSNNVTEALDGAT